MCKSEDGKADEDRIIFRTLTSHRARLLGLVFISPRRERILTTISSSTCDGFKAVVEPMSWWRVAATSN